MFVVVVCLFACLFVLVVVVVLEGVLFLFTFSLGPAVLVRMI